MEQGTYVQILMKSLWRTWREDKVIRWNNNQCSKTNRFSIKIPYNFLYCLTHKNCLRSHTDDVSGSKNLRPPRTTEQFLKLQCRFFCMVQFSFS
jgi:hypothetical protein